MFDFAKLQLFSELAKKRWDIPKEKAPPGGGAGGCDRYRLFF
jgi:hypothetical protein